MAPAAETQPEIDTSRFTTPFPGTEPDPDDPLLGAPALLPGQAWHRYPYHSSFLSDPVWYDAFGRDLITQRRIFNIANEADQVAEALALADLFPNRKLDIVFEAAVKGKARVISALLSQGAKAYPSEESDDVSLVPLHAAAYQGHLECVQVLITEGGVDPDVCDETGTPLQRAAMAGHVDIVRYLLDTGKVDISRQFVQGGRPRHPFEWFARTHNVEIFNILLGAFTTATECQPSPGGESHSELTVPVEAISAAADYGNIDILKKLLGLSQGTSDRFDRDVIEKAVGCAFAAARVEILKFLMEMLDNDTASTNSMLAKPDMKESLECGLVTAVKREDPSAFDELATYFFLNKDTPSGDQDEFLRSCLYKAAMVDSLSMVRHLTTQYKIDINNGSPNPHYITPAGVASARGNKEILEYFLKEHPLKPDLSIGAGPTNIRPLWYAVKEKQVPVIELLLEYGAPVVVVPEQEESGHRPDLGDSAADQFEPRIAACLDAERSVRVYLTQQAWESAVTEEIRSSCSISWSGQKGNL